MERLNRMKDAIDRGTVYILLGFALFMSVAGYGLYQSIQAGARSEAALCAFRNDLERRIESAEKFLIDHPKGIPGIPAETIKNSLQNQEATLATLDTVLDCDTVKD